MKLRVVNSSLNWRPSNLGRFVSEARRYPLIPMSILVLLLVLPAIFADLMAPHHPTDSYEAKERLLAPVWSDVENDHGIAPSWNHVLGTFSPTKPTLLAGGMGEHTSVAERHRRTSAVSDGARGECVAVSGACECCNACKSVPSTRSMPLLLLACACV